jgi:hypothetical protein
MVMKKYNKYNKNLDYQNKKVVIAADENPTEPEHQVNGEELDVPRQSPRNTEAFVSSIPSPHEDRDIGIHHEIRPRGGLKALQDKGLRITSYTETDGSGAPITKRRDEDEDYY